MYMTFSFKTSYKRWSTVKLLKERKLWTCTEEPIVRHNSEPCRGQRRVALFWASCTEHRSRSVSSHPSLFLSADTKSLLNLLTFQLLSTVYLNTMCNSKGLSRSKSYFIARLSSDKNVHPVPTLDKIWKKLLKHLNPSCNAAQLKSLL